MKPISAEPNALLAELRGIVPTEQIELQGQRRPDAVGAWAVEPATQEELVDLMKWACGHNAAVYTRHPRSGDAETCAERPRIYLRARRMKRIKDIDVVSGTVTVQSGITMDELHRALGERHFTTGFPTRPWGEVPLGAVLAASLEAHWGPPYGSMEQHVLGLGVVFSDGATGWSRLAPTKAVGPDFDRLFLGSRGQFAIIYEATLRIYQSTARTTLCYGAESLSQALEAIRLGTSLGLDPRATEVLTPTSDRAWGRKRVGLSDECPVLVIVEPWGVECGLPISAIDEHYGEHLKALEPPPGWNVHEGMLPPPREWTSPVVGVPWEVLIELGETLGERVPAGLWVVRMSRQGAWLSLADPVHGEPESHETACREVVESLVKDRRRESVGPWDAVRRSLKQRLDPHGILNPGA